MANRSEITKELGERLEWHIDQHNDPRIYWAKEVTFDYAEENMIRVDYMRFKPINNSVSGIEKGDFYCYEVKSSVEDFKSKNGHNFIGDLNYYIMPEDVFQSVREQIPYNVGVMIPAGRKGLETVKNAKRKNRSRPASEMLLMMWRSSRREVVNQRRNADA